ANFPTDKHLASWCGLRPGNNASVGKRKSGVHVMAILTCGRPWSKRLGRRRTPRIPT
ncbi:MAG: transposase, partial [Chloracidobacterium sp.]|nr:transposase [Chloracidobacterium sp.]